MRVILSLTLLLGLQLPAHAAATAWQELAPGVKLRLITADKLEADGTTMAALELDMPQSFKTYWKVPGQTGLPTELNLTGSRGIASYQMLWPFPLAENQAGYLDYVYRGTTVLPLRLTVGEGAATLKLAATLGICSEVCTPAQANFELPLDFTRPDGSQGIRIRQAMADVPIRWDQPEPAFAQVRYDASRDALVVSPSDPRIDLASVIASRPDGTVFAPAEPLATGDLSLPVLSAPDGAVIPGAPVELEFLTPLGAYNVNATVAP